MALVRSLTLMWASPLSLLFVTLSLQNWFSSVDCYQLLKGNVPLSTLCIIQRDLHIVDVISNLKVSVFLILPFFSTGWKSRLLSWIYLLGTYCLHYSTDYIGSYWKHGSLMSCFFLIHQYCDKSVLISESSSYQDLFLSHLVAFLEQFCLVLFLWDF